ncbi:2,3-bisphosphoglycerate-independent phosphoglycerate mutase [Candidatus Sumerlaeota bacterium]|nr:2,3-bisphosphoglycerate-independent phosphoglycerate mutase [Candidatus Sumerlaeota bacterium]
MTTHIDLLHQLAQKNEKKIILLVMDGVGDIHTPEAPQTSLEAAKTPNLDALARRSALGRSLTVDHGITPGSGPGHLGLFGYDPAEERYQIGRGVLEALGIGHELKAGQVAARGNFCSIDAQGLITDRRAGRPTNLECKRISSLLDDAVMRIDDVAVRVLPVKEHRFCVIFDGPDLDPDIEDTDPQKLGVAPLPAKARKNTGNAKRTEKIVQKFIDRAFEVLKGEMKANALTLRGFSAYPHISTFQELYHLNPVAVASYPLYRGVARLAGMKMVETGATPAEEFATVAQRWNDHDFFFIHIKKTDSSGEDGNQAAKIEAIEAVDAALPDLLALKPGVIAVTGDHSTPHVMKGHSWHPVPLLIHGPNCDVDSCARFTETECRNGSLGTIPASRLMGLLLANAEKLTKFGA